MRSFPNNFRRSSAGPTTNFYEKAGLVGTILGSGFALGLYLDGKIESKVGNLDGKIGSNADKSDAKFESLRSELGNIAAKSDAKFESLTVNSDAKFESLRSEMRSNRSELLNAFSNMQGERIRALEVAAAEQKKNW